MIDISLTITMGQDSKIMTLDEAKMLWNELNNIFGNKIDTQNIQRVSGSVHSKEERQVPPEKPQAYYSENVDTKIGANPKVEAARNRAAQRTSGCGRR